MVRTLDLVARDCFDVVDGGMTTLQVDIDAGKSIHVVGNSKAYHFRPVIFVEDINQAFDSKLVRLDGEITSINTVAQTLTICDAIPAEGMDNLGCVKVHFGADAAFFDNLEYAGAPRSIDELLSAEKLGLELTVVGWLKFPARQHSDADRAGREYPLIELEALVAELGEFLQVEGSVAVDADSTGFAMQVSSGGPIITADNLSVMFQQGSAGVNGSRIISRSGDLLDANDVVEPLPVQVDGTLQLIQGSDPLLMAALVIIDKDAAHTEQVTGIILNIAADGLTLNPDAPSVCGIATDSLNVVLSGSLDIWTVTITNSGSEIQPDGTLATGQTVGMTGNCESGGYQTDNIVIVDDQRV
ncbi:MAG: hypothetical protein GY935_16855 [Gammaproteobacteria bacterium]|nr:hypothetical protein [Gammaproteobacteria bacterium]